MNHAAAFQGGGVFSALDDWRHLMNVNVLGLLNGVQRNGRPMVDRRKSGAIVSTGSKPDGDNYTNRKHALQFQQGRREGFDGRPGAYSTQYS
jgi:NADP-dependent 3-hydroxy acid dehydrogenase YdfG